MRQIKFRAWLPENHWAIDRRRIMRKVILLVICLVLLSCNPNAELKHSVQMLRFEKAWLLGYKAGIAYGINQNSVQPTNMWIQDSINFENYLKQHE